MKMDEINHARRAAFNEYIANESTELTALVRQALASAVEVLAADEAYEPYPVLIQTDESASNYNPICFSPKQKQVESRVERVMIEKAVAEGLACPITLISLTEATAACVAPCYHVFDNEAIQTWLITKNTCPECRRVCSF